jgi:hypothetical protein
MVEKEERVSYRRQEYALQYGVLGISMKEIRAYYAWWPSTMIFRDDKGISITVFIESLHQVLNCHALSFFYCFSITCVF